MTTNHIDELDEALIRSGRVDRRAEFHLAHRDVPTQLYRFDFEQPNERPSEIVPYADDSLSHWEASPMFAHKVPEWELSQA
jgi:hypothetical protein